MVFCCCSEECSPASTQLRYLPHYSCRRVRIKFSKYFLMPCIKHAMGSGGNGSSHVFLLDLARFIAGVGLQRHLNTSNKLAVWEVDTFVIHLIIGLCVFDYTEQYHGSTTEQRSSIWMIFQSLKMVMWLVNVGFAAWWGFMRQPCFFTDCPANVQPGNLTREQWEN